MLGASVAVEDWATYYPRKTIRHGTMQTKLTLRMDDGLIAAAKVHAAGAGKSLSQIVAEYFEALTRSELEPVEMTPAVARLRGSWKGSNVDEKDYHAHLEDKYLRGRDVSER